MERIQMLSTPRYKATLRTEISELEICESRVVTRLRYVHKLVVTTGFPNSVVTKQKFFEQRESVVTVPINLNVPNGVSITRSTAFGAV